MPRLTYIGREGLSKKNQSIHDRCSGYPGHDPKYPDGNLSDLWAALFASPETANRWEHLQAWVRRGGITRNSSLGRGTQRGPTNVLTPKVLELVMITVGREGNCQRLWHTHVGQAVDLGLNAKSEETIRTGGPLENLQPDEYWIVRMCQEMCREHGNVSDETFNAVKEQLGERGLVELMFQIAYEKATDMLHVALRTPFPEPPNHDLTRGMELGLPLMEVPPGYPQKVDGVVEETDLTVDKLRKLADVRKSDRAIHRRWQRQSSNGLGGDD